MGVEVDTGLTSRSLFRGVQDQVRAMGSSPLLSAVAYGPWR